jgi:hypothetical protein
MSVLRITICLLFFCSSAIAQEQAMPPKPPAPFEVAAHAIRDDLLARYRTASGAPDLAGVFNVLGALAGFGCQMAVREGLVKTGLVPQDKAFAVVETKDGGKYFFGAVLDSCLIGGGQGQISMWTLVAGAAQSAGAKELPNIKEIAGRDARTLGSAEFGVPQVPERYRTNLPLAVLKKEWPQAQAVLLADKVDPKFWGWTFALAAQHLILAHKDDFDPAAAATIVVEAAMPMSKMDPAVIMAGSR